MTIKKEFPWRVKIEDVFDLRQAIYSVGAEMANSVDKMKSIFRRYAGGAVDVSDSDILEREFGYGIIQLTPKMSLDRKEPTASFLGSLFRLVDETGGDVNQFCCGTVLILYGVPLADEDIFPAMKAFMEGLSRLKGKNVKILLGFDKGVYGPFGYEKRCIVTVINERLPEQMKRLKDLPDNLIHVRRLLAERIPTFKEVSNTIIID